jgi:hypothetical protein
MSAKTHRRQALALGLEAGTQLTRQCLLDGVHLSASNPYGSLDRMTVKGLGCMSTPCDSCIRHSYEKKIVSSPYP